MSSIVPIAGVSRIQLVPNVDERGSLTEVFRRSWNESAEPRQWNLLVSSARVMRGMKVHLVHTDVVVLVAGRAMMVLRDFRHDSPSFRTAESIELVPGADAYVIPPGVGHAFYSSVGSTMLIGVSRYWDRDDELGCRWDDDALGIDWPDRHPIVSENDRGLPSVDALERITATNRFMR